LVSAYFAAFGLAFYFLPQFNWLLESLGAATFSCLAAIAMFGYFIYAQFRNSPIACFCPHCAEHIDSDTEWTCGFCRTRNRTTKIYSFLNRCQTCPKSPDWLVCPNEACKAKFILLGDEASLKERAAKIRFVKEIPIETPEETRRRIFMERNEEKDALTHKLTLIKLDAELFQELERLKCLHEESKKTLEEDFAMNKSKFLGVDIIYETNLKEIERLFADDEPNRIKWTAFLERWKKDKM
jgi:hypothetical protein